jgi:hypothetical protein
VFDTDRFIEECIAGDGQQAVREVVNAAVSDSAGVMAVIGIYSGPEDNVYGGDFFAPDEPRSE